MAHKKGVGSTDNGRDSNSKRLGVKLFGGEFAIAGNIIVRQRGTKFHPGENVYMGRDHTLHARVDGFVDFRRKKNDRTYVNILPSMDQVEETVAKVKAKKAEPKAAAPAPETKAEAAPKAEAPKAEAKAAPVAKAAGSKPDDLKKIEGIGPKSAELLAAAGILTYADLAGTDVSKVKEILENAGSRYKLLDPTTWPKQAEMAAAGNWDELKKWQDELDGGKVVSSSNEEE